MSIKVLALDLERTLMDHAMSGQPRPGLREFSTSCHLRFGRVAIYTTVETADARQVIDELAGQGYVSKGLLVRLEFIDWCGEYKDLSFVPDAVPAEVLLVDDDGGWVRPDQRDHWIPIAAWDGGPDSELARVRALLEDWLLCEPERDTDLDDLEVRAARGQAEAYARLVAKVPSVEPIPGDER